MTWVSRMTHNSQNEVNMKNKRIQLTAIAGSLLLASTALHAQSEDARAIAERLVDAHFQNSTLTREEQIEELLWFAQAAEPFRGLEVNTVAEGLTTHVWERDVLAPAFRSEERRVGKEWRSRWAAYH